MIAPIWLVRLKEEDQGDEEEEAGGRRKGGDRTLFHQKVDLNNFFSPFPLPPPFPFKKRVYIKNLFVGQKYH